MSQQKVKCSSCSGLIQNQYQNYAVFPKCNHAFHMPCLINRENHCNPADGCPMCYYKSNEEMASRKLFDTVKDCQRYLSAGVSLKQYKSDLKMAAIEDIVMSKYKSQLDKINKVKEGKKKTKKVNKWIPFDWTLRHSEKSEEIEVYNRSSIKALISGHEDIVLITIMKYTMADVLEERLNIFFLIENGYNMIDWFLLRASWGQLLSLGINPDCFATYFIMVDISSVIDYYKLGFKDIYNDLCHCSLDDMAKLRMTVDDLKTINFIASRTKKAGITTTTLKKSAMWSTIAVQAWQELEFVL
jgi:hypothetical protein